MMNTPSFKTTPMPVRRCELNLSEEDEEEDDSGDAADSQKIAEQIRAKLTQGYRFNNGGKSTPSTGKCSFNSKTQDLLQSIASANKETTTNKENEQFNTPHNSRARLPESHKKDPKKLSFSPATVVYSSKKVIPSCRRHLDSINENDNFIQSLAFNDILHSKSDKISSACNINDEQENKLNEINNHKHKDQINKLNAKIPEIIDGITGVSLINKEVKTSDFSIIKNNNHKHLDQRNKLNFKDSDLISGVCKLNKEEKIADCAIKKNDSEKYSELINKVPEEIDFKVPDTSGVCKIIKETISVKTLNKNDIQKRSELMKKPLFKVPETLITTTRNKNSCYNSICHVENENGDLSRVTFGDVTFNIGKKLGNGGSSVVYLATQASNSTQVAIKVVKLDGDQTLIQGYLNEVELLSKLQNSDVVIKMFNYAHIPKENKLYVVMECGDVDFNTIIKANNIKNKYPVFPIVILVKYWIQMLEAVNFIHNNGVIHSDLKPANFLKVGNRLKLIDFGIASSISSDCTSIIKHVQTGTFNYMSPEALQDTNTSNIKNPKNQINIKISYKSDVWSLGCILYLLLYGKTPFGHITRPLMKMAAITDPNCTINFQEIDLYPAVLVKTAKRCLVHNPYDRPTVAELLELPREPFGYLEKL